jgi:uncharacterized membrane protein
MVWLVLAGFLAWCLIQQSQLDELKRRLGTVEAELKRLMTPEAVRSSNKIAVTVEALVPSAPIPVAETAPDPIAVREVEENTSLKPDAPSWSLSDWLSQNGLAWIGGGTLALGGLLLVAYAAQSGLFTPGFRIIAAIALALAALAAGEGLRRGLLARGAPNRLVAALTTGAGGAVLYAAIWASYGLYHFIPSFGAAALLTGVSLGLLALALLHGEAMGVSAVAGAFAIPLVSGVGDWSSVALDAFAFLILLTGMITVGLRRWSMTGAVTLLLTGLWALARLADHDAGGVALLAASAPALTLAMLIVAPSKGAGQNETSDELFADLIKGAMIGAAVLAFLLWMRFEVAAAQGAMLTTGAIIAVVAVGGRYRLVSPKLLLAPAAVCVFAVPASVFIIAMENVFGGKHGGLLILWLLPDLALLAGAGFDGARRAAKSFEAALIGAAGAALTLTLAAASLAQALPGWSWAVDLAFAVLLGVGAVTLALGAEDARTDLATAAWIAAAAEAVGLALYASVDGRVAPTAYGALGVVLAVLAVRVKWRGFAESAVVACLAAFAALLTPAITGAALSGASGWLMIGAIGLGATLIQVAAWRVLKARSDVGGSQDAISTLAVMSGLLGLFLVIQTLGVSHPGAPASLDDFSRASIRTLLLLAAGLMLVLRGAATPLGRWRGPVFLAAGAAHGLLLEGLALHPWWGGTFAVVGPPVFDGLMLGLLAPAVLLTLAARRMALSAGRFAKAATLAALTFLLLWIVSELRRLFHGASLAIGPFGYSELAAYAAALLAFALGLEAVFARVKARFALGDVAARLIDAISGAALSLGLLLLLEGASPWWGPLDGDLKAPALFGLLYVAACGFSVGLAVMARRSQRQRLAQFALATAGLVAFVLLTLAVRYGFHGGAMRVELREASLETWTFSAVWALYGLAALALGAGRRDATLRALGLVTLLGTTAKVFLFDLARLEGVIRAASFLALGVVLLVGALAARRFSAGLDRNAEL